MEIKWGKGKKFLALSDVWWSWCNQPDNSHEKSLQRNRGWPTLHLKISSSMVATFSLDSTGTTQRFVKLKLMEISQSGAV